MNPHASLIVCDVPPAVHVGQAHPRFDGHDREPLAVRVDAGRDGLVSEMLVGGTLGWYVWPRLAVGPELAVLQGNNHRHVLLTGRLTVDLAAAGRRTVMPYVVVSGGLSQTRYQHPDASVTTRDGVFTAGAGGRASVTRRVNVGLEARTGWEPHVRVTGRLG